MNYENFLLIFSGFQHGNLWYKNYNFIEVNDGILTRLKPLDIILNNVIPDNKLEKVKKSLESIENNKYKLLYINDDQYGYWDFSENKFVGFANQREAIDILKNFLMELFIL